MDVLLYILCGSCVTEVNEQRVWAHTRGSWGAWRCPALQVPPPGFHREGDPETPERRSGSSHYRSSPSPRPVGPAGLLELGVGGDPLFAIPGSHGRGRRGVGLAGTRCWCLPRPGFSIPGAVAQVADSRPQSPAPQIRASCRAPARCVHPDPTCPASGLSVASLHPSGIFSPFLFPCAQQPGSLPCILPFVTLCSCPCPSRGPGCPRLLLC